MPPRKKAITPATVVDNPVKTAEKEKNKKSSLEELRLQVNKEINNLFDSLITKINEVELMKKQIEEKDINQAKSRSQKEEEENFNLLLKQKKQQAEFDEKLEKERKAFEEEKLLNETELKQKKEVFKSQEEEFRKLKDAVEDFPGQLEKATEETRKQLSAELKKEFETEKTLMAQKNDFDLKLLEQKIANLQQTIKQQERETQSLKSEKANALDQMNNLAVAVVKGKEKEITQNSSE